MNKDFIYSSKPEYVYDGRNGYIDGYILNQYTGSDDHVIIPDDVVGIRKNAFAGKQVKEITFPRVFSTLQLTELHHMEHVKKVTFLVGAGFERIDVSALLLTFPNLEDVVYPNVDRVGFYTFNEIKRWPAFHFTGPVKRVYADWRCNHHPGGELITLFVPEVSPGYVEEVYRPSLISTFVEHPEWYEEKRAKAYVEWIKKNALKFFNLCVTLQCTPLIIRCVNLEGMRFSAPTYDSLIEFAEQIKDTELKSALIQQKANNYDLEKLRKRKEKQDNNDLDDPLRPHAMRKTWSWSTLEGGLCITNMKSGENDPTEESIYIPEQIGGKRVIGVNGQVFQEIKTREIVFPETVETIRGNMCLNNAYLESVTIEGNISSIPYFCFACCSLLTGVDLPKKGIRIGQTDSTKAIEPVGRQAGKPNLVIGMGAFKDCKRLPSLTLNDVVLNVESFENTGIQTLMLRGTPVIPRRCFSRCRSLKVADMRDVVMIEEAAFSDCTKLTDIHVSGALRDVHPRAFDNCKSLMTIHIHHAEEPDFVRRLFKTGREESYRFVIEEDINQQQVSRNNYRMKVESQLFGSYSSGSVYVKALSRQLQEQVRNKELQIPEEVQDIPVVAISEMAFQGSDINKVELPGTVSYIGRSAFQTMRKLESVNIPGHVRCIPEGCFYGDITLSFVDLTGRNTWIGKPFPDAQKKQMDESVTWGTLVIGYNAFRDCREIADLTIDHALISGFAFSNTGVRKVMLRNTPVIPISCFKWCDNLIEADLRDVVEIQFEAFLGCSNLSEIHLSDDIEIINSAAFCNCISLKKVHLHGVRHPELVKKLFTPMKRFGVSIDEYVIHL